MVREFVTADGDVQPRQLGAQGRHAVGDQFVAESGEEFGEDLRAPGQQRVPVPALRDSAAWNGLVVEHVAFDDEHAAIPFGQHPCRQQAADAGAQDYRVITDIRHFWSVGARARAA
jgi:hypothetical protein